MLAFFPEGIFIMDAAGFFLAGMMMGVRKAMMIIDSDNPPPQTE